MTPLTLSTDPHEAPSNFPALMELLGSRPQPAVVWYGSADERVELSGRVLQNWAIKLVGLFRDEVELEPGTEVVVDAAPHWKACAAILAVSALGCPVTLSREQQPLDQQPRSGEEIGLVITDRPLAWEASEALGEAELAALSPGLLDDSYADATGEELPGWVLDISAEVRQHPDQLLEPLPEVPLPPPTPGGSADAGTRPGRHVVCAEAEDLAAVVPAQPWTAWRAQAWQREAPAVMLDAWARGGTVVLVDAGAADGRQALWSTVLRNEGVG